MSRTKRRHKTWVYVFHGQVFDDNTNPRYNPHTQQGQRVLETELLANGVEPEQAYYIAWSTQAQTFYHGRKCCGYESRDRSGRRTSGWAKRAEHQRRRHEVKIAIAMERECPQYRGHSELWG